MADVVVTRASRPRDWLSMLVVGLMIALLLYVLVADLGSFWVQLLVVLMLLSAWRRF